MNQLSDNSQKLISYLEIEFTPTFQKFNLSPEFTNTKSPLEGIHTITSSKPSYVCFIDKINNITLNEPIYLTAEYKKKDKIFIVRNEEFNIWGEGNSFEEAKKSFKKFFLYEYRTYRRASQKKIDKYTKELFNKYKQYLKKK